MREWGGRGLGLVRRPLGLAALLCFTLPWLNPFAPGPSPATVPLLFSFFCGVLLLLAQAGAPMRGMAGLRGLWLGLGVLGALLLWRTPTGLAEAVPTLAALLLVGLCAGVVAAGRWPPAVVPLAWLAAALFSAAAGLIQYVDAEAALAPWINQARPGEAYANLRQRNQFASLTSLGLLAWWWLLQTGAWAQATPGLRRLAWAMPVLLVLGNAASSSRTGLVQLFLMMVFLLVWHGWRQRNLRWLLVLVPVSYLLALALLPWLAGGTPWGALGRWADEDLGACHSRGVLWSNMLDLVALRPWAGWGWGALDQAHFMTPFAGPRFCDILDNAHNLPLHLAVELGLPVAVLVCGGFGVWVWRHKPWRETDATRQLAWAALAMLVLHSLLEYPLWYGPFQMALGACLGWLCVGRGKPKNLPDHASNRALDLLKYNSIAIVLIALVACAAWDYWRSQQIYLPPEARAEAYRGDTLGKISGTWLYRMPVRFAELTTVPLTPANAARQHDMARELLYFSPEPRVVERLIDSAAMLGLDDEAQQVTARYKEAFPKQHAAWAKRKSPKVPPPMGP